MTPFQGRYLACCSAGFAPTDMCFISGPERMSEPFTSVMVESIVEYKTVDMADAISRLPETVLVRENGFEKLWRWQREDRYIEISTDGDNTSEDGIWLASPLSISCTFSDLVELWLKLANTHQAIYIHAPSCRMYTPCSFLEEAGMEALGRAFLSGDQAIRGKALQEFQNYKSLHGKPRLWAKHWSEKTPHMTLTLFDLNPPVVPVKCKDFWQGRDWLTRMGEFDGMASAHGMAYFAYPTNEWVGGKYRSGFMAWTNEEKEGLCRQIAKSLDVLSEG